MARSTIKIVAGDNLPAYEITLSQQAADGSMVPIDVSAVTTVVRVYFRNRETPEQYLTIVCDKSNGGDDGVVSFEFPDGAVPAGGQYEGEIELDFNGKRQTVFDVLRFRARDDFNTGD